MSIFENMTTNTLPYGNPEFSDIREQNMIYVDKTELIGKIASQRAPYFYPAQGALVNLC
ncbi:MAG: AAA family ATPase [Desulfovibrionaceae bacterium]|nr:AAA family ATPase [Desulfovibrionaceae bacterium]